MDESILNVEQAMDFLGISEKTLIKLLREEHLPARKIGREWRFSKTALTQWLSGGDSLNYINRTDYYRVSEDEQGKTSDLFESIRSKMELLKKDHNLGQFLQLEKEIGIPESAALRVSYKQQRDVEKLEFKIFWPMRDECRSLGRDGGSGSGAE
ncbi:MAG: helix-turn-helix domain-containing protein [Clostridia bacterium]|nr:helix-turn-helix domain-containing protein [Clostridia bacterium]